MAKTKDDYHSSVEELLKQGIEAVGKKGIKDFEIFANSGSVESIDIESRKLHSKEIEETKGIAIRVIVDNRIGHSRGIDCDKVVGWAIESAKFSEELKGFGFPENPGSLKPLQHDLMELKEMEELIISEVSKIEDDLTVPSAGISSGTNCFGIANSSGTFLIDSYGSNSAYVACAINESSGYGTARAKDKKLFLKELHRLAEGPVLARDHSRAEKLSVSGLKNVILEKSALAGAISLIFPSIRAESFVTNASRFSIGEKELGDSFNLASCIEHQILSSRRMDGEGLLVQQKKIFEQGVLLSPLSKLENSFRLLEKGIKVSPGNSSRTEYSDGLAESFEIPEVLPGKGFAEEQGDLVVLDVQGLHTVDPFSGNFSLAVEHAYLVEGKERKPVKGFAISGNVFDLLKSCEFDSKLEIIGHSLLPRLKGRLTVTG